MYRHVKTCNPYSAHTHPNPPSPHLFPRPENGLESSITADDVAVLLPLRKASPLGLDFDGRSFHVEESSSLSPPTNRLLQNDDFAGQFSVALLLQVQVVGVFQEDFGFTCGKRKGTKRI